MHGVAQKEAQLQPKQQICWMSLVQPAIALIMHKKVQKSLAAAQKAELLDVPHTASTYIQITYKNLQEKHCCSQNKLFHSCAAGRGRPPSPTALEQQNLHQQCP